MPVSGRRIGDVDFGPHALDNLYVDVVLDWYDYLFKGIHNQFATEKPVQLFTMGVNEYRQQDDWPPPQAQYAKYFLHSDGKANSLRGTGSLSTSAPKSEAADSYVYDPGNPVPTTGGPLCCAQELIEPGPRDQRSVENRDDVLVYSTGPLAQDLDVTGPVSATVRKIFRGGHGFHRQTCRCRTRWLCYGCRRRHSPRMRYRDSREHASLMNPGQTHQIKLDLRSTSNVFLRGHTLRLEISSSNSPRFDRNLNTGEEIKFGAAICFRHEHDFPRCAASIGARVAGYPLTERHAIANRQLIFRAEVLPEE